MSQGNRRVVRTTGLIAEGSTSSCREADVVSHKPLIADDGARRGVPPKTPRRRCRAPDVASVGGFSAAEAPEEPAAAPLSRRPRNRESAPAGKETPPVKLRPELPEFNVR